MYKKIFILLMIIAVWAFSRPILAHAQSSENDQNTSFLGGLAQTLGDLTSRVVTLNNTVKFVEPKTNFNKGELPIFHVSVPIKNDENIGKTVKKNWKTDSEEVEAVFTRKADQSTVTTLLKKTDEGEFTIQPENLEQLKPGEYTLAVSAKESFVYTRDLTQDFSWGVLAVNTDKSVYTKGETAHLSFGVVDNNGHTVCNANLELEIEGPDGTHNLSTDDKSIKKSDECRGDTYTLKPDYSATFTPQDTGAYQMTITATTRNGSHQIRDYFEVRDSVPFSVQRTQFPSRMYPREKYEVKLTVTANEDFQGAVTDFVPKDFRIYDVSGNGKVENKQLDTRALRLYRSELLNPEEQKQLDSLRPAFAKDPNASTSALTVDKTPNPISWNVNWQKGQTYSLSYTIVFPLISPEFYLVGPLRIGDSQATKFEEIRQWQIAGDAQKCWDGGGADNNWTTAANWAGDTVPGTTDTPTFGSATCGSVKSVTINSGTISPSGIGGGVDIQGDYTGTITQGTSVTFTIGSSGFSQAGGIFTGSNGTITIQSGGDFTLSGGTFTSTTGTLSIRDDFTISGGTFNNNSGTVQFNLNADRNASINATATFNNVTFTGQGGSGTGGSSTVNISSGKTVTVNGLLTLNDDTSSGNDSIGCSGATLIANGNIAMTTGKGWGGSCAITLNNTSDQTITGNTTAFNPIASNPSTTLSRVPGLTINKSSGTVSFVNQVFTAAGGWTYTSGTLDFSSLTDFGWTDTSTITGSITVPMLRTAGGSGSGSTETNNMTIASGTTVTVTGTLTLMDLGGATDSIDGPGKIQAQGDIDLFNWGYGGNVVITINGTGDQNIIGHATNSSRVPSLTINKPSGTLALSGNVWLKNDWKYTAGTVDFTTSTIGFAGNLSIDGAPSSDFYNVYFNGISNSGQSYTITVSSGTVMSIAGTLTLFEDNASSFDSINGPGSIVVKGNITNGGGAQSWGGTAPITFSGTASQTITAGSRFLQDVTINKSSGSVTLAAAFSSSSLTLTSGTLDIAGNNLTLSGTLTLGAGSTFKLIGTETVSYGTISTSSDATTEYSGSGTYASLGFGTTYGNLKFSGTGSYTTSSNVSVAGDYIQTAGTFILSSANLTIGGDFTKSGGTFTPSTNAVIFNDATQSTTISGSNTFYNLTATTPAKQIYFTAGTTQTITGILTIRGFGGNPIRLDSTSGGTAWNLNVNGSSSVSNVSVKDSDASGGSGITALYSANRGNNTNWTFSGSTASDWYYPAWTKRKTIVIDHTKVSSTLTDFPLMVKISSDSDLAANAQADGDDFLFTAHTGGDKLSHEIEKYDSATGTLIAWVKIPSLSNTVDTTIYMYYGNASAANQQDSENVWDSNHKMVMHLKETSGQHFDSTSNNNDTTAVNVVAQGTATGQINGADSFSHASTSYLQIAEAASLKPATITISAWVNLSTTGSSGSRIVSLGGDQVGIAVTTAGEPYMFRKSASGTETTIATGTNILGGMHLVMGIYNNSNHVIGIFVDGVLKNAAATSSNSTVYSTGNNYIGRIFTSSDFDTTGVVDEVRVSDTERTGAWMLTSYNNQYSPSTFYSVSSTANPSSVFIKGGTKFTQGSKVRAQ